MTAHEIQGRSCYARLRFVHQSLYRDMSMLGLQSKQPAYMLDDQRFLVCSRLIESTPSEEFLPAIVASVSKLRKMNLFAIFFLFICSSTRADSIDAHGVHLPLYRRSGSFIQEGPANFTKLSQNLAQIEARYARTHTDVEGNRIVRRWSDGPHGADEYLLNGAGNAGFWSARLVAQGGHEY